MAGAGVFVHGLGEVVSRLGSGGGPECGVYRDVLLICFAAVALSALLYRLTRDASVPDPPM